jgi:nucleoid-associated protein YgaU
MKKYLSAAIIGLAVLTAALAQGAALELEDALTHIVASGETITQIAQGYYGQENAYFYPLIAVASGLPDPDTIFLGQRLIIPILAKNLKYAETRRSVRLILENAALYYDQHRKSETAARDALLELAARMQFPPEKLPETQTPWEAQNEAASAESAAPPDEPSVPEEPPAEPEPAPPEPAAALAEPKPPESLAQTAPLRPLDIRDLDTISDVHDYQKISLDHWFAFATADTAANAVNLGAAVKRGSVFLGASGTLKLFAEGFAPQYADIKALAGLTGLGRNGDLSMGFLLGFLEDLDSASSNLASGSLQGVIRPSFLWGMDIPLGSRLVLKPELGLGHRINLPPANQTDNTDSRQIEGSLGAALALGFPGPSGTRLELKALYLPIYATYNDQADEWRHTVRPSLLCDIDIKEVVLISGKAQADIALSAPALDLTADAGVKWTVLSPRKYPVGWALRLDAQAGLTPDTLEQNHWLRFVGAGTDLTYGHFTLHGQVKAYPAGFADFFHKIHYAIGCTARF